MAKSNRELVGKVVSDKTEKTITVLVETYKKTHYMEKELNTQKNMLLMMKKMKQKSEILFV